MRIFLTLIFSVMLVGCPSSPSPSPEKEPRQTPSPKPAGVPSPKLTQEKHEKEEDVEFPGIWTTVDGRGQPFDIIVFPGGQAVTTWTGGSNGVRGERGFWRQTGNRIVVAYDDGWTDVLESANGAIRHRGFAPGTPLNGPPANQAPASRMKGPAAAFVGIWRMNKEPDGSYLYITLQSNGRAVSTINGGTEGRWKRTEKGALCTWPDGWVDLIERTSEGWQKRSRVGLQTEATADLSVATRVGAARFEITP